MRAPASELQTTIASDKVPAALLVEIQATTTYRYAFYATDLVFDSNTYSANNGKLSTIETNLDGRAPKLTVTIQNLDRVIRDWLQGGDRRGTVVVVRVVMTDNLDDGDAALEDTYELDSYDWDGAEAHLVLGASPALRGVEVPGRRTQTWFCPFNFKGSECGYVGDVKSCDFTYTNCKKLFGSDPRRFGAFIGAPQADLVVI